MPTKQEMEAYKVAFIKFINLPSNDCPSDMQELREEYRERLLKLNDNDTKPVSSSDLTLESNTGKEYDRSNLNYETFNLSYNAKRGPISVRYCPLADLQKIATFMQTLPKPPLIFKVNPFGPPTDVPSFKADSTGKFTKQGPPKPDPSRILKVNPFGPPTDVPRFEADSTGKLNKKPPRH